MQRPHPTQLPRAPAHGFWPREIADRVFQNLGDDFRRGAARFFDHREIGLPLFDIAHFELIDRQAG